MYRLDFKIVFIFKCWNIIPWQTLKTFGRGCESKRFYGTQFEVFCSLPSEARADTLESPESAVLGLGETGRGLVL